MFYQKRTTSGTMLSQTHNLYGLRNRQNVVRSHSYNFHHIQSITTPSILSILHLILLLLFAVYVLDDLDQPEVLVQADVSAQDLEARRKERGKQPCKLENYLKHVIAYKL